MRRHGNVRRSLAVVVLLSLFSGCATPAPTTKPETAAEAPPPVAPPPTVAPSTPSIPPAAVGPRPAGTEAPPPRVAPPPPAPPPPSPPPIAPPVPPSARGRFVVLNFDNADIETVVHAASEIVGFNYVLAPDVRGKVTVQTSGRIPQENVFNVLLAILEVNGFTAVKAGDLYKIVRIEGAKERAVPTIVGTTPDPKFTDDEVITQIIPIRFSSVSDLATLLRPLVSARGTLVAHRETNMLMVTDTASNIARVLEVVRLVDVEVALDELQIIPIQFADAQDIATILNQLFASGRLRRGGTLAVPGAPAAPTPAAAGAARPPAAPAAEAAGAERGPLILAERRSNSLIVHGRRPEIETVRKLIAQLDVNIYGGRRVFIYFAENAKAKDLAATLNAIYGARETAPAGAAAAPRAPGQPTPPPTVPVSATGPLAPGAVALGEIGAIEGQIRFIADETTNAVIVTTYPRSWAEIEGTIKQLDRQPRQVLIEVLVAEITLSGDMSLGFDWALRTGRFSLASQSISTATPSTITPLDRTVPITTTLAVPGPGLTAFSFASGQLMAILNAMASQSKVNVLSSPSVMTSENKKAVINVSDSIPIVTSQQVPIGGATQSTTGTTTTQAIVGTQSVEYRDAGVILTVTPRIGEHGTVALDVKQEVNDIGAAEPPTGSRRIIKREAETSVVLLNNQTLVLGGLIRDQVSTSDRGIPFLKDIPILGFLFGARDRAVTKTELIILITPRVVGTAIDAARITDQIRRSSPALDETIRTAPRPPTLPPPPVPGTLPVPAPAPATVVPLPPPAGREGPPPVVVPPPPRTP
jgi:general secretion pathway protein D